MRYPTNRTEKAVAFDAIVQGRPLFDDGNGGMYGMYFVATDTMKFGGVCNAGLIPYGEVPYDDGLTTIENVEHLVDHAKRWCREHGREVSDD